MTLYCYCYIVQILDFIKTRFENAHKKKIMT